MNRNNPLLDSIKAKIGAEKTLGTAPLPVTLTVVADSTGRGEPTGSQEERDIGVILEKGGFEQLYKVLEVARKEMEIERKAVYVDEDSAEVLELLRKKAKIKANVLVSYLLQEFFQKHKAVILEKRSNKLLD